MLLSILIGTENVAGSVTDVVIVVDIAKKGSAEVVTENIGSEVVVYADTVAEGVVEVIADVDAVAEYFDEVVT